MQSVEMGTIKKAMDDDAIGHLRRILILAANNANKDVIFDICGFIWRKELIIPDPLGESDVGLDL